MNKLYKYIFLIYLTLSDLNANDLNNTKSALEMFMFKVGITSLTYDLENEKKNIYNNSQDIEQLKKNIKYLLEQNIKSKLSIKNDHTVVVQNKQNENIQKLKLENKKLKRYIKKLENKKTAIVYAKKVSTKQTPFQNGKIVRYLYKNDKIEIESCDKYGWCKLKHKQEYIPKFKLQLQGIL